MMQVNLFISNFRKYKDTIIFAGLAVLFVILFGATNRLFSYFAMDDVSSYTRITMHELYGQDENIDILFLGSSHCYRALNPEITDSIFEENTFNGGTSAQCLDGSYAILVEADKKNDLKTVYLEMYYGVQGNEYKKRTEMTSTYAISDYMRPSVNKFCYLINASDKEYWMNGFMPAVRNRNQLMEKGYLKDILMKKSQASYKNYEYPAKNNERYQGKGYVARYFSIENNGFSHEGGWTGISEQKFTNDDIKSIKNIIDYCEKHQIELVLFVSPMPDYLLTGTGNYDNYINQVEKIADEHGIKYYDFNLLKEQYFPNQSTYFADTDHLNVYGAKKFSELFAMFFTGKLSKEEMFYASYEEKMKNTPAQVYGIVYDIEESEEEKEISIIPICNKNPDIYCTIYKKAYNSEKYTEIETLTVLQNVTVPVDEKGELCIYFYSDPRGENMTNEIHINY
ncbi:MAG: hypothetical protein J6K48_08170 [Lachnospiraceae bacterium]|nr:hypothetical protein [Lachnospiraceae bacterium]